MLTTLRNTCFQLPCAMFYIIEPRGICSFLSLLHHKCCVLIALEKNFDFSYAILHITEPRGTVLFSFDTMSIYMA